MIVQVNGVDFDVTIDPGCSGSYWEPPEPAYIEEVKVFLKSKKIWKAVDDELPDSMEKRIWDAIEMIQEENHKGCNFSYDY